MSPADYCPTCETTVVPDSRGRCSWCETPCGAKPKRSGKPVGKHMKHITPELLDVAHLLYDRGLSMRQVAEAILDRTGYANVNAAVASLYEAFRLRGWQRRERITAVKARCTKHGRASRTDRSSDDHLAYRREMRAKLEAARRPECAADECNRRAMNGRDHCHIHDPEAAAKRLERVTQARALRAAQMHRWGDVKAPIIEWAAQQRYPAMRLAEASGVPEATVRRTLRKHDDDQITPELLARLTNGIRHNRTEGAA